MKISLIALMNYTYGNAYNTYEENKNANSKGTINNNCIYFNV